MSNIQSYQDLEVWKESRELVKEVYEFSNNFSKEEQFGLTSQMRRSAISIPSSIAEGFGRNYSKDSIQFFHISRGALYEVETQSILAIDLGIGEEEKAHQLQDRILTCKKLLNGFIRYFKSQSKTD